MSAEYGRIQVSVVVVDCEKRFPSKIQTLEKASVDELLRTGGLPSGPVLCLVHGSNPELGHLHGSGTKVSTLCVRVCGAGGHVVFFSGGIPKSTSWLASLVAAGMREGRDYRVCWESLPDDLLATRVATVHAAKGDVYYVEKPTDLLVGKGGEDCLQVLRALLPVDIILQGVCLSMKPDTIPYFASTGRSDHCWFCASELIDLELGAPFSWDIAVVDAAIDVLGEGQLEGKFVYAVIHPCGSLKQAECFSLSRTDSPGALRLVWEWVKAKGRPLKMRKKLRLNDALTPENLPRLFEKAHDEFTQLCPKLLEAAARLGK